MWSALTYIIPVVVVLFVACGIYYSWKKEKQRRIDLAIFAKEQGFSFSEASDRGLDEQFSQFSVFCRGRNRIAWNTMKGTQVVGDRTLDVIMGDYKYTITSGHGKNRHSRTYRLSYLATKVPFPRVPNMVVRPENLFDKFTDLIGFDDIDFESVEFSKRFHIASDNKRFAYDLIDPRMMEFLLAESPKLLDMASGWTLVLNGKRRWQPEEFAATLGWTDRWFAQWPTHVSKSLHEGGYVNEGRQTA